jgi:DUF4097 and DUF4098 domain-containing protein YvlB
MRNRKIAKAAVVLTALVLVWGFSVGAVRAGEKFEEKFNKTEALARDGKVIINNVSGGIVVKTWDKAEVQIAARKVADVGSLEKAKENWAKVTIEVTKSGNIVQIDTKYPERSRNLNVSVHYELTIPDKAAIKIKNVSGSVDAAGIGGTFEGNVTSGSVTLAKLGGSVDCRTVSGRIDVQDGMGEIDLKTVSGNINAVRIKGSVDAETTSGRIELVDISEAKNVRVKVLSGGISYDGQLAAGGKFSFETLSGSVRVALPANAGFELDAEAFSGHVNSAFPVTMQGTISPKELRGVVNNGGATLRIKTFSGAIDITKK